MAPLKTMLMIKEIPMMVPMENLTHFRGTPERSRTMATSVLAAASCQLYQLWPLTALSASDVSIVHSCLTLHLGCLLLTRILYSSLVLLHWSPHCSFPLLGHVTYALHLCAASNSSFFGEEHVAQAPQIIFPHICLL